MTSEPTLYDLCTAYVMAIDWGDSHPEDAHGADAVDLAEDQLRWFFETHRPR